MSDAASSSSHAHHPSCSSCYNNCYDDDYDVAFLITFWVFAAIFFFAILFCIFVPPVYVYHERSIKRPAASTEEEGFRGKASRLSHPPLEG